MNLILQPINDYNMAFRKLQIQAKSQSNFRVLAPREQTKDARLRAFYQSNEPTPLLEGGIITSDLSRGIGSPTNKDGLDIFAKRGTEIRLPIDGTVISVFKDGIPADDSNGGFGNQVIVRDNDGQEYQVSHMMEGSINLNIGDTVDALDLLGKVGNTGSVLDGNGNKVPKGTTKFGNHIDWEIKRPDGINMAIREIKDFGEQRLTQSQLANFETDQLSFEKYHEVIKELDPQLAKDFDRGFLKGVGSELQKQYRAAKESFVSLKGESAFEQSGAGFLKPLKMAVGILQAVKDTGLALGEAAIRKVTNAPEAARVSIALLEGHEPDVEDIKKLAASNDQAFNAINQALGLTPTPLAQFVSPAIQALQEAPEKGQGPLEALGAGSVRGTERAGLIALFRKFGRKKPTKEITKAREAGIGEQDITRLTRETDLPKGEVRSLLELQKKAIKEPRAQRPLQAVGDDVVETIKRLKEIERDIGKQIGDEVGVLKFQRQIINNKPFIDLFKERAKQLNIKFVEGKPGQIPKLDFSRSKIGSLSADKALLNNIWTKINRKNVLADIEALQGELGNIIAKGKRTGELTQSQGIGEGIRQLSDDVVSSATPKLKGLKSDFSIIRGITSDVKRIAGPDAIKSPQLLRRAFSNVSEVPTEILERLQRISTKFDVGIGKNILDKAEKAMAIETSLPFKPAPTGFEGGIQRGVARGISSVMETQRPAGFLRSLLRKPEKIQIGREQALSGLVSRLGKGPVVTTPSPRIGPAAAQPLMGIGVAGGLQGPPKPPPVTPPIKKPPVDLSSFLKFGKGLLGRKF